jgi:4-hydroxy-tetrahydrodipicolinate synthase
VNPAPVKAALRLAGFDSGGVRLPLIATASEDDEQIRRVMEEAGLL